MALLFSHVRVSAPDGSEAEFLVKGIPRDYDDLENYTAWKFTNKISSSAFVFIQILCLLPAVNIVRI